MEVVREAATIEYLMSGSLIMLSLIPEISLKTRYLLISIFL
jgi:hypothetical protein